MRKEERGFDILGLGAVAVDDLIYVESYPPPDVKSKVLRRERHCGGLTATALVLQARDPSAAWKDATNQMDQASKDFFAKNPSWKPAG